ncbi:MAG: mechanosensitive ion channel [Anaerolineae bacterium]|nr:mechanosensitive ion channel [Anaerolineae bacterium]
MDISALQTWVSQNSLLAAVAAIGISLLTFFFTRNVIARSLVMLAARTATKADDIIVRHIKPYRVALLAPLLLFYAFAQFFPDYRKVVEKASLLLVLWVATLTLQGLLDAINELYEKGKNYNGVSIQGYLDIVKILLLVVAVILSVTLVTGQSPGVLLTGLGALTAVLLLIFQGTLLSLVASIQIVSNDLIKEGDWIEVPSYEADGDVVNINLHTIKVRNFDMTYTVIPTYRITEVSYKNWRGMKEAGGRRIQRSIYIDMNTIKFCDPGMLKRLGMIDLIGDYVKDKVGAILAYQQAHHEHYDSPLDGPQITNIEIFRRYTVRYLRSRPDIIITPDMPFLVRTLAPSPNGLPVELYFFVNTTEWLNYELIQSEVFDHLLAAAANFDLRVFQQPTGLDFSSYARALASESSQPAS